MNARGPRIGLVIGDYHARGGGAERWTDQHARGLLAAGCRVDLFARSFAGAPEAAVCHEIAVPAGRERRLRFAAAAERTLRRQRCDVVCDMGDGWRCDVFLPHHGTRAGGFAANSRMLAPWLRPLRTAAQRLPRYREFQALARRQYVADGRTFVALSKRVREDMVRHHRVPDRHIAVIPNGIDTGRFVPPTARQRRDGRRRFGLPTDGPVLATIAHNFRLKGVDSSIRTVAALRLHGIDATLLVVGKGKPASYRRLAERLDVADQVVFAGDVADPRPCLHAADVFVHPTYYDPCSLVVLEALACGLPVVTTAANGAGELVVGTAAGHVIADPTDVLALCQATIRLLAGDSREAARGVAERHDLTANLDRYLTLYGADRTVRQAA